MSKCKHCGVRQSDNYIWKNIKLYRWYIGGRWAYLDDHWWPVKDESLGGWLDYPGHGVHYSYMGITKREDYRK